MTLYASAIHNVHKWIMHYVATSNTHDKATCSSRHTPVMVRASCTYNYPNLGYYTHVTTLIKLRVSQHIDNVKPQTGLFTVL